MEKIITIYAYLNVITGKYVYVGQTKTSLKKRAGLCGQNYVKGSKYFGPEIERYGGFQNFEVEVLATTTDPEYANLLEWFYTIEFDTQYPNGCNDSIGQICSEDNKKRISKTLKQLYANGYENPNKGKKISEETRKKLSESHKGKSNGPHSDETKKKISEARKGQPSPNKGKHLPEETRRKISESLKGQTSWIKGKHHSEETLKKLSESKLGHSVSEEARNKIRETLCSVNRHWFTDGEKNVLSNKCPEGFYPGRTR